MASDSRGLFLMSGLTPSVAPELPQSLPPPCAEGETEARRARRPSHAIRSSRAFGEMLSTGKRFSR